MDDSIVICGRQANIDFLRRSRKVYFVAMHEELDASATSSEVVYTGIGKARATRALVRYLLDHQDEFKGHNAPVIVSCGTAGSAKFDKGSILLVDNFVNNGSDFIKETISCDVFPEPTPLLCASSDFFVGPENFSQEQIDSMHEDFDCMDMEAFALANVCRETGVKFCAVKCISDGADSTVNNFDKELPLFKARLNAIVGMLEK